MSLIKWNDAKFPTLDSVFDNFFSSDDGFYGALSKGTTVPAVNTSETKNMFQIEFAVPGMNKENFNIGIENNQLIITAECEESLENDDKKYTRKEYSYESFYRSFRLPENVNKDKIKASYEDGILKVMMPKVKIESTNTMSIPVG